MFGSILFMGTWISMMIACVNGSGIPILVRKFVLSQNSKRFYLGPSDELGPRQDCWADGDSFPGCGGSVLPPGCQLPHLQRDRK